jgi:type VI secretion system protein ImpH
MDTEAGRAPDALSALCASAPTFDFYQIVRLLHRFTPDASKSVGAGDPADEVVRFRGNLLPSFAASDVHELHEPGDEHAWRMMVNFAGIANPVAIGALPAWYSSLARGLEAGALPLWWVRSQGGTTTSEKRPQLRAFFDLFDDRLIGLWYRAWRRHFLPAQHEAATRQDTDAQPRSVRSVAKDWAFVAMLSVLGLYTEHQRPRLRVDIRALVRHAGSLGRRPTTADALQDLLVDYFGVPAEVQQFVARPMVLPPSAQLRLGSGAGLALGKTTILGARVALGQSGFRVVLGPLDHATYKSFLPASAHSTVGDAHHALADLVRFAVGPEFDFELQLILRADDVPELRFDSAQDGMMRLGWSTWLGVRPPGADAYDTLIPLSS